MTTLYAQPYDIDADGFYFTSAEDYATKASECRNRYGQPVEEFEIQFIDGAGIDGQLFTALKVCQADVEAFMVAIEDWSQEQKIKVIVAVGEAGYGLDLKSGDPDGFDVDLYVVETVADLAQQFVADGLYGPIPEALQNYIDYDAIGRDLAVDYGSVCIAGTTYFYRCG